MVASMHFFRKIGGFHECHDKIIIWMLRILINLNGYRAPNTESNEDLHQAIGLTQEGIGELNKTEFLKLLKQSQIVNKNPTLNSKTTANLKWLQQQVGLNNTELEILLFAICLKTYPPLDGIARDLGTLSKSGLSKTLSVILELPHAEITTSLSTKSNLTNSGLLEVKKDSNSSLDNILEVPESINQILGVNTDERPHLLDQFFYQDNRSSLELTDYTHIKNDITLIKNHLNIGNNQQFTGTNILIYGAPGTGKTELVKALAKSLRIDLFQVSIENEDGEQHSRSGRISAFQMAQRVLNNKKKALLLFDEIEDIFVSESGLFGYSNPLSKSWFNNILENNNVPTFWLSNKVTQIDDSYLRRFDYVLELKIPPKSVRKKIITNSLGNLVVSENWLEQISQNKQLAPGIISRAAKVISNMNERDTQSVQNNMELVIGNTLRAMGKKIKPINLEKTKLAYQLEALNPSQDIQQLVTGLQTTPSARICLYGPPGTGKTALGHYISDTLDKPLIVKRASDILSPYVGVAEMNIADMFEEAKEEQALLLLDEADSFLQDRTTLKQSWEITQVNELLTQMEAFDGLFICSTNLIEKLDAAASRRFDFKIKLNYLKASQVWRLFCSSMNWNKEQGEQNKILRSELSKYSNLTPGDFANVLRQHRLAKHPLTTKELIDGLERESQFKQDRNSTREIGFHASI